MMIFITYFTLIYFLVISVIAFFYKKYHESNFKYVSILVPVFNEGENVFHTIKSISNINYEKNKFEVIIINDGSTDDTIKYIKKARLKFNNIDIKCISLQKNLGKKHALIEGIKEASGEFIITIDSDSIVSPNAIKNILKPFVNEKIGGVAGNIVVKNINEGLIPAMMDVIFCFCFEFLRSSQSVIGKVLCTPGALSAYRKSAILPLLSDWKNQKFLGDYTSIGEDRALTCLLLKNNWDVVYQSNAVAKTYISPDFGTFCKMIIRWVRGDIRENILMFSFMCKKILNPNFKNVIFLLHYIAFNLGIIVPIISLPFFIVNIIFFPFESVFIIIYVLLITIIWAIIPFMIYARRYSFIRAFNSFLYSIFSLLCISWIPLYSLLTIKSNKWLTRN